MATSQIVAVSKSQRQHKKHKEESKHCGEKSGLKRKQSFCCFTLPSDKVSSSSQHHTAYLHWSKNTKGQKENHKTIQKKKEANESHRTMNIDKNGGLRNRVSWGFYYSFVYYYFLLEIPGYP